MFGLSMSIPTGVIPFLFQSLRHGRERNKTELRENLNDATKSTKLNTPVLTSCRLKNFVEWRDADCLLLACELAGKLA